MSIERYIPFGHKIAVVETDISQEEGKTNRETRSFKCSKIKIVKIIGALDNVQYDYADLGGVNLHVGGEYEGVFTYYTSMKFAIGKAISKKIPADYTGSIEIYNTSGRLVQVCNYADGQKHGKCYDDGGIEEIYHKGILLYKSYGFRTEDGEYVPLRTICYENEHEVKIVEFYDSGNTEMIENCLDGNRVWFYETGEKYAQYDAKTSIYKTYYKNGRTLTCRKFVNGHAHGPSQLFDSDGTLIDEVYVNPILTKVVQQNPYGPDDDNDTNPYVNSSTEKIGFVKLDGAVAKIIAYGFNDENRASIGNPLLAKYRCSSAYVVSITDCNGKFYNEGVGDCANASANTHNVIYKVGEFVESSTDDGILYFKTQLMAERYQPSITPNFTGTHYIYNDDGNWSIETKYKNGEVYGYLIYRDCVGSIMQIQNSCNDANDQNPSNNILRFDSKGFFSEGSKKLLLCEN